MKKTCAIGLGCMVLTCLGGSVAAQESRPVSSTQFAARRTAFYRQIQDGVAILLGAPSAPQPFLFRQSNNFYYFSGVEVPDAVLVLDAKAQHSMLFLPSLSQMEMNLNGNPLQPGKAAEKATGIDQALPLQEFVPTLANLLMQDGIVGGRTLYVSTVPDGLPSQDFNFQTYLKSMQVWDNRPSRPGAFVEWVSQRFPTLSIKSYDRIVNSMRRVKSPEEIAILRRNATLTTRAMNEAIRATAPGMYEHDVAAAADFIYSTGGAQRLAYGDIVASGPNGNVWHYFANRRQMLADELVLMDSAAELDYYAEDLTRTWPVSGRFNPEQLKMYECVLDASKKVIDAVQPGVTIQQLNEIARKVYEEHGFGQNYPGFIGHYVGLSVHDVGPEEAPFVPGVVFNVEPLLDIPGKHAHVRLEDTVVVTETGHEWLTSGSPKDVQDLYRLYDEGSYLFPSNHKHSGKKAD